MSPALILAGAYLLGSVPFSYLLASRLRGVDVRAAGSRNVGATNVLRVAGRGPAAAALAFDAAKGAAPVLVAARLGEPDWVLAGAVTAAVLGHVFPVFLAFRGGKGVATAAGGLGTLAPEAAALAAVVFLATFLWKRIVSLSSMVAVAAFPFIYWLLAWRGWLELDTAWPLAAAAVVAGLVLVKHRSNLERLLAGTERRLGDGGRG